MSSASIIKIKRSQVTGNPPILASGELAYSALPNNDLNGGDRLYIGIGTETNGNAANHYVIGGKYFTDLLDHNRGTVTADSAIITDSFNKINEINIDNININENTISSTDTNGNLILNPNGNGSLIFTGNSNNSTFFDITDGTNLRYRFDTSKGIINQTTRTLVNSDSVINISTSWNNVDSDLYGIKLDVTNYGSSSDSRFLDLLKNGISKFSVDLDGNLFISGQIIVTGEISTSDIVIPADQQNSFRIITKEFDSSLNIIEREYLNINTDSDIFTIKTADVLIDNNLEVSGNLTVKGDITSLQTITLEVEDPLVKFGSGNSSDLFSIGFYGEYVKDSIRNKTGLFRSHTDKNYYLFDNFVGDLTSNEVDSEGIELSTLVLERVITSEISGTSFTGDITTDQTQFNLINTTAEVVNFAGQAVNGNFGYTGTETSITNLSIGPVASNTIKTVNIGTGGAVDSITNINIGSNEGGTTYLHSETILGSSEVQNLFNTVAKTINFAGSSENLTIGSALGTTTINSEDVVLLGDLEVKGGVIKTDQTTFDLINDTATTLNFAGSASTGNFGYSGTGPSVTNLSTGQVSAGNTKTVNLGTGGVTDSITDINIGSSEGGITTIHSNSIQLGSDLDIQDGVLNSDIDTGTAPFIIKSTTRVSNLNVESAGTADKVSNLIEFDNLGLGDASGVTFDGSQQKIISYNTLGAVPVGRTLTFTTENGLTGGLTSQDLTENRAWTFGLTGQALALHNLNTSGIIVRTAEDTINSREIVESTGITITDGDGILGNPTISLTEITSGDAVVGTLRYNSTTKTSGQLYGGTTDPSNTTRLNYDGNFHASLFVGSIDGGTY